MSELFGGTYQNKRVLVTGHTGFKGSWLSLWLHQLGASVHGFALAEDPVPSAYSALGIAQLVKSERIQDLRTPGAIESAIAEIQPDLVFHLAAQPLVRLSYDIPFETVETNILGTARVLEALRLSPGRRAAVLVTSDKCYQNLESGRAYIETDPMGGHDVYSMSKGACELLIDSYRRSFSGRDELYFASARAGNVIGGGDYSKDRLVPDAIRALAKDEAIPVRNPRSIRPWQHVLEPLSGYLCLGAGLLSDSPRTHAEAWNFGPGIDDCIPVAALIGHLVESWGSGSLVVTEDPNAPHEARLLRLSTEKAASRLNWNPTWDIAKTIRETALWYRSFESGAKSKGIMSEFSAGQINRFCADARKRNIAWAQS